MRLIKQSAMNTGTDGRMREDDTSLDIFGVCVQDLSYSAAEARIFAAITANEFIKLAFLNAHCANIAWVQPSYHKALQDFLVLPDGIGIDIGAQIIHGKKFNANLNGTDFVPSLIKNSKIPLSIGLIGARAQVAETALESFRTLAPQHEWRLLSHGFFDDDQKHTMLADLKNHRADIILVAMGVPQQELFITREITQDHCKLAIAVGALFDFQAGQVSRAPQWMRTMRMEWLYRLMLEPGRLWKRYLVGNPLFLWRVFKCRLSARNKK